MQTLLEHESCNIFLALMLPQFKTFKFRAVRCDCIHELINMNIHLQPFVSSHNENLCGRKNWQNRHPQLIGDMRHSTQHTRLKLAAMASYELVEDFVRKIVGRVQVQSCERAASSRLHPCFQHRIVETVDLTSAQEFQSWDASKHVNETFGRQVVGCDVELLDDTKSKRKIFLDKFDKKKSQLTSYPTQRS